MLKKQYREQNAPKKSSTELLHVCVKNLGHKKKQSLVLKQTNISPAEANNAAIFLQRYFSLNKGEQP